MREKWEQRDVAECDAVACGREFRQGEAVVDAERGADMCQELGLRMARDFNGGELPHAREKHVVVCARIFHQDGAAARVAENCRGNSYAHGGAFDARRGNFVGEAEVVCAAPLRDGADRAPGNLRRTDYFAEFHERLIPVAGRVASEPFLRGVC